MIQVQLPPGTIREREYIVGVILRDFLGLDYRLSNWAESRYRLTLDGNRHLELPDRFFPELTEKWLKESSLPQEPLTRWCRPQALAEARLVENSIPIVFGDPPTPAEPCPTNDKIELQIDIFGSAFFCLTRYEEAVRNERDVHGRFPAQASIAFREGFLERPIVNEYAELLWTCLHRLWPRLTRPGRQFELRPTHDVDRPYRYLNRSLHRFSSNVAGDLLLRRNPRSAFRQVRDRWAVTRGNYRRDPYNTFSEIAQISENLGLKSLFYFIASRHSSRDGDYDIGQPAVKRIMQLMRTRGHEIGLHASYDSPTSVQRYRLERSQLLEACSDFPFDSQLLSNRQHYLRWDAGTTPAMLDQAGFATDSTLAYPEHPGFRCGTCYEFPLYDLVRRRPLRIRENPLIVMECSVIDSRYMGIGDGAEAFEVMHRLKSRCRIFDGQFVLLWHNHRLVQASERALYQAILSA